MSTFVQPPPLPEVPDDVLLRAVQICLHEGYSALSTTQALSGEQQPVYSVLQKYNRLEIMDEVMARRLPALHTLRTALGEPGELITATPTFQRLCPAGLPYPPGALSRAQEKWTRGMRHHLCNLALEVDNHLLLLDEAPQAYQDLLSTLVGDLNGAVSGLESILNPH